MRNPLPSQAELRELFDYDPNGYLVWLHDKRGHVKAGDRAGHLSNEGYWNIKVNQNRFRAHRLIYAWHHGTCPETLDHINRNRADSRIENLRPATVAQNQMNRACPSNNQLGHKNIRQRPSGSYEVHMTVEGQVLYKNFPTLSEAIDYANHLRQELHGQFAHR